MPEVKKLYFAYGSNMSQSRLEERVGKVTKIGVHRLACYKLVFDVGMMGSNKEGKVTRKSFANLHKTGKRCDYVEGVIFELTPKQMRILDQFEGAPYHYNRVIESYKDKQLTVYISINEDFKLKAVPQQDYLDHIITGCTENDIRSTRAYIRAQFKV